MISIDAFDPKTLILIALFNPATIAVAIAMGSRANQWQKLPVAAFAAALAGFVLYWLAAYVGVFQVHAVGGEAGLVVMQFLFGLIWASLAYALFSKKPAP